MSNISQSNWKLVELRDVIKIYSGKAVQKDSFSKEHTKPYKVAGAGGFIGWSDKFNQNGPLITIGRVGSIGSINYYNEPIWATDNTLTIIGNNLIVLKFIEFFLKTVNWTEIHTGSTQPLITQKIVYSLKIPLPPIEEQYRIVTQIEKLLVRVDAAKERLDRVPAIMQQFRQSVLAAACSGRLTEDWRENNSGSEPLPVTNEKFSFKFIFHEPTPLPSLWHYDALGNLGQWKGGGTPSTNNSLYWDNGSIPWTSPKDMKSDIISDSKDHITTLAIQEKKLPLIPTNAIIFVVRGLILAHSFPVAITGCQTVINQDMRGIIPDKIYPKFLLRTLQNEKNNILNIVRSSTHGTKRIESDTLKLWPIPIPPLEEQKEICRRIEALFTHANKIELKIISTREQVEAITQSILHQGFTGRLV